MMNKYITGSLLVLAGLWTGGCSQPEIVTTAALPILDTRADLEISASEAAHLVQLIEITEDELHRLGQVFDAANPDSEISKINQLEIQHRLPISDEMYRFLTFAFSYHEKTDGVFDISTRKLKRMWGFEGGPRPGPISPDMAKASLETLGMDSIKLTKNVIQINSVFVQLTLNDMLRGYIADLCVIRLRNVFRDFKITIGETARAWGKPGPGENWTHALPHPVNPDQALGMVRMAGNIAVSSSRLYAQTQIVDGKTIGHVIDPRSGMPVEHTLQVVVVAPTATAAQMLAATLNILGVENCKQTLLHFPRCEALIIPNREPLELWMTENFHSYFQAAETLGATTHAIDLTEADEPAPPETPPGAPDAEADPADLPVE